jgi:hypothetical protein
VSYDINRQEPEGDRVSGNPLPPQSSREHEASPDSTGLVGEPGTEDSTGLVGEPALDGDHSGLVGEPALDGDHSGLVGEPALDGDHSGLLGEPGPEDSSGLTGG